MLTPSFQNSHDSFDALPLVIQTIATYPAFYKDIDAIFERNKTNYYLKAAKSSYYTHPLFVDRGIDVEIYAKRLLGILLSAAEENKDDITKSPIFQDFLAMIRKRWKKLVAHIEENTEIDLAIVRDSQYWANFNYEPSRSNLLMGAIAEFAAIFHTFYPNMDHTLPHSDSLKVILFLAHAFKKKVVCSDDIVETIVQSLPDCVNNQQKIIEKIKEQANRNASFRKASTFLKKAIYDHLTIFRFGIESSNSLSLLAFWFANITSDEKINLLQYDVHKDANVKDVQRLCQLYLIGKLIDENKLDISVLSFLDDEKPCFDISPQELTPADIEKAITFVIVGLIIQNAMREYKLVKKAYFKNNSETQYLKIDTLQLTIKKQETENRQLQNHLQSQITIADERGNRLKSLEKAQLKETQGLRNEINRYQEKLSQAEQEVIKLKAELERLKNSPQEADMSSAPTEIDHLPLDPIKNLKAIVIGGAESWQSRLKEILPNYVYLWGDEENFDEDLISNSEVIFINTKCKINHGCYYRLINVARRYNKKIVYLSKTNINLALNEMLQGIAEI